MLRDMFLLSAVIAVSLLVECTNPAGEKGVASDSFQVHLVGTVLTKDGNPVQYAVVYLTGYEMYDTTDNSGKFKITVDKESAEAERDKRTAEDSDTLYIYRDGQVITAIEIVDYIDTLPDILILQRDISGTINSESGTFGMVEAVVWNEADNVEKNAELFYNEPTSGYSGFVYFTYTGQRQEYAVYVNVYSEDSIFVGRSDTIYFSSVAGDIEIPAMNPFNAVPVVSISADSVAGVNDTLVLSAAASDKYDGTIISWEWDMGTTGDFIASTPDSSITIAAPGVADSSYECVVRVMDNDGNESFDTVTIRVETRAPVADAGSDTIMGVNDTVYLTASGSSDETEIVEYAWKCGDDDWFTDDDGDTAVVAPDIEGVYICSLKVTDDDGNSSAAARELNLYIPVAKVKAGVILSDTMRYDTAVILVGDTVLFSGSFEPAEVKPAQMEWLFGDAERSTKIENSRFFSEVGEYLVQLSITDSTGRTRSDTIVCVVHKIPEVSLGEDSYLWVGDTARLRCNVIDKESQIEKWEWKTGDGDWLATTDSEYVYFDTQSTEHSVVCSCTVIDNFGYRTTTSIVLRYYIPVKKVAVGEKFSLVLRSDGSLWGCGMNKYGALGNGTFEDVSVLTQLHTDVEDVVAGAGHCLILKSDGTLFACGKNTSAQIGNENTDNQNLPVNIANSVKEIAASFNTTLFLKDNGELWGCGYNKERAIYPDTSVYYGNVPVKIHPPVKIAEDVKDMAVGSYHILFLKTEGTAWARGSNSKVPFMLMNDVRHVAAGDKMSVLLITQDNTLWEVTNWNDPQAVVVDENVESVVTPSSDDHAFYLKMDNTLWARGGNSFYRLGGGVSGWEKVQDDVRSASSGMYHTLIVKTDGTVWASGINDHSQLCTGSNIDYHTFSRVLPPKKLEKYQNPSDSEE